VARKSRYYGGYRGRRTWHDILKILAISLAMLVALLLAVLFVFRDKQPGDASASASQSGQPAHSQQQPPDASGQEQEGEDPPDTSADEEREPGMAALEVSVDSLLDGSAAALMQQGNANAVVITMKQPDGTLNWLSQQPLAQRAGVSKGTEQTNLALQEWNAGDVYTIARVCCFRDNAVPYYYNAAALRASYGNWRDEIGSRWLNPDSEAAREYLAGLCAELAQLGFDEIVLEHCAFPVLGNLEAVSRSGAYVSGDFAGTAQAFLQQVRAGVQPYGTKVSLRVEAAVLTGEDSASGLSAGLLESGADRIWLAGEQAGRDGAALLTGAGITRAQERLVLVQKQWDGGQTLAQAMLTQ